MGTSEVKNFFRHVGHALWYGEWEFGCMWWKRKPWFGFFHCYYDGYDMRSFHLGPFWIEVSY